MTAYYIHMNQGIAADLRHHTLCSGQFMSCAPVVMYNQNTHVGALYHLAGCSELDQMRIHHLQTLLTVVKPDDIYVLVGLLDPQSSTLCTGHVIPLMNFFGMRLYNLYEDFNGRRCFSSITVREINGSLDIQQTYADATNKLNTREAIRALPDDVGFLGEDRDEKLRLWR